MARARVEELRRVIMSVIAAPHIESKFGILDSGISCPLQHAICTDLRRMAANAMPAAACANRYTGIEILSLHLAESPAISALPAA